MKRCTWAKEDDPELLAYHDHEYGRKKGNDAALFEKLCLECFQAGLSWRTVLKKRAAFRQCFFQFDLEKVAGMTQTDVERLMADARIIRNRRKIEAVIHNAGVHLVHFSEPDSFGRFVYAFRDGDSFYHSLKTKGYRFMGPTICRSFLMSVGAMEGHEPVCDLYQGDG